MMLKIIGTDNLNRETVADTLVLGFIPREEEAKAKEFVRWLNRLGHAYTDGGTCYKLVDQDYRLSRGMEDLV